MQTQANGISIHYRIDGSADRPWLIFSNPLVTNLAVWDAQVARLSRSFRILRYDQRGHGGTDAPPGRYSFEQLADDLLGLLDALAIQRAHVVGLSMGAATAVLLAQRSPERLDRIALCDTSGASTPLSHRQWEERIEAARKGGMAAVAQPLIERWLPRAALQAKAHYVDVLRRMILATPVNGFVGCAAAIGNYDVQPMIAALKHPTLFVVGRDDVTAAGVMRQMHEALPGSRYAELADAGHISSVDQPQAFTDAIEGFLLSR